VREEVRIGRTLPPAAAPIPFGNVLRACFASLVASPKAPITFEAQVKTFFEIKKCFLVSSGKAALTLILQALHEMSPDRDEVLIPAFTCYSVPAAIKKAGLRIRLCDIDLESLGFNREKLQEIAESDAKKKRLLCVIPTHLFGIPADVAACREVFGSDVSIVEDAAQAMGGEWSGRKLGTCGDVGFFSLGRGKALSCIEGGIIVTDRDDIGKVLDRKVSTLPDFSVTDRWKLIARALFSTIFQNPVLYWLPKSLPFLRLGETIYEACFDLKKLSPAHCALAGGWDRRLRRHQAARSRNVCHFLQRDEEQNGSACFPGVESAQPLIRLPVLVKDREVRDGVLTFAASNGLGIMQVYPAPVHKITELTDEFCGESFPCSDKLCEQSVTVPVHEYLTARDRERIQEVLHRAEQQNV